MLDNPLHDIMLERSRQDDTWGANRDLPHSMWLAIIMEELGEAAKAFLEDDTEGIREEVTQVCAVALAWLENIVRRGKNG